MSDESGKHGEPCGSDKLLGEVRERLERKEREEGYRDRGFWVGVGVMGVVGWSVILPAVAGAFLGLWIDRKLGLQAVFSGLLAMIGLVVGCWNAWRMIQKVLRHREEEETPGEGEERDGCGS